MVKLAFFDLDGTLSVPRYLLDGQFVTGFTDDGWREHCETMLERGYDYCLPIKPVKRYAESLKAEGAVLYVLSLAQYDGERLAKIEFVNKQFPGLFADIIFVKSNREKTELILEYARNNGLKPGNCELIEDTYSNVLNANDNGIKATHISYLIYDL